MTIATVQDDGYPHATTVSFVNDGLAIYFGTSSQSRKAANIEHCDKISLTINKDYSDWENIQGLAILGTATIVSDPVEQRRIGNLMFKKYPEVQQYMAAGTESVALFRIDPKRISLLDYRQGFGHTEVIETEFIET